MDIVNVAVALGTDNGVATGSTNWRDYHGALGWRNHFSSIDQKLPLNAQLQSPRTSCGFSEAHMSIAGNNDQRRRPASL